MNSYRLYNKYGSGNFEGSTLSDQIAQVIAEFIAARPNADINDVENIVHQTAGAVCAGERARRATKIRKAEKSANL